VQDQMINPDDNAFDMVGTEDDVLDDEPDYTQVVDDKNDDVINHVDQNNITSQVETRKT
jgi:hypothetical protein